VKGTLRPAAGTEGVERDARHYPEDWASSKARKRLSTGRARVAMSY
jgi:hypothetical protein